MNDLVGLILTTSSYKKGIKNGSRYTFDVGTFRDPIGNQSIRAIARDGRDPLCWGWIREDARVEAVVKEIITYTKMHLVANKEPSLSIGLMDARGEWIAPAIAEMAVQAMDTIQIPILITHLCLED